MVMGIVLEIGVFSSLMSYRFGEILNGWKLFPIVWLAMFLGFLFIIWMAEYLMCQCRNFYWINHQIQMKKRNFRLDLFFNICLLIDLTENSGVSIIPVNRNGFDVKSLHWIWCCNFFVYLSEA